MSEEVTPTADASLRPDEAFAALGNEIRMNILQVLGEADAPMTFTALRDAVGIRQGAQFGYHLRKLVGHFVEKRDDGYTLREPGRRIVEAVLAGAVSEGPVLDPTPIDFHCLYCGDTVEASYESGVFGLHCLTCEETLTGDGADEDAADASGYISGRRPNLTRFSFPPAGMLGRSPEEAMRAATTWTHLDAVALSSGVCPRCSATVAVEVTVVTTADIPARSESSAEREDQLIPHFTCTNCIYEGRVDPVMALLAEPRLLAFVGDHGLNVTTRGIEWGWDWDQEVLDTDPPRYRFTFSIDDDSVSFVVDESMQVVDE